VGTGTYTYAGLFVVEAGEDACAGIHSVLEPLSLEAQALTISDGPLPRSDPCQ